MPLQFPNRLVQCGSTQPSGPCHRRDSSMPQKPRIRRCHQPPLPFVQIRIQESMFCTQSGIVGHDGIIYFPRQKVQLILAGLLSEPKPNVFYELGYADALNKNPILLLDETARAPSDLLGLEVLRYSSQVGLFAGFKEQLQI